MLICFVSGLFGISILGFLLIPFYFIHVPESFSDNPRHVLEDVLEAFIQMRQNPLIICAITGKHFQNYKADVFILTFCMLSH
jgi:hypothetical protein